MTSNELIEQIVESLGEDHIPEIYRRRVRRKKTRAFDLNFPARENQVEIVHTLLGIQLKSGQKLIGCPDLATARYLRVFARIGCGIVAIPYEITKLSELADELESAWQRTILFFEENTKGEKPQPVGRKRAALVRSIRNAIIEIGPGELMPAFDTETKQRKSG